MKRTCTIGNTSISAYISILRTYRSNRICRSIVDLAPYMRNQNFRMPFCSKRGKNSPLRVVMINKSLSDFQHYDEWLPIFQQHNFLHRFFPGWDFNPLYNALGKDHRTRFSNYCSMLGRFIHFDWFSLISFWVSVWWDSSSRG